MGAPAAPDLLVEALLVWLRKLPASILSNASMWSLPRASNKRRTKVLFCSASDDTVASSFVSLPSGVLTQRLGNNIHDATRRGGAHCPEDYSPKCVEGNSEKLSS